MRGKHLWVPWVIHVPTSSQRPVHKKLCSETCRPWTNYLGRWHKKVSITERPSLGQAALELRATPQLNFLRTGLYVELCNAREFRLRITETDYLHAHMYDESVHMYEWKSMRILRTLYCPAPTKHKNKRPCLSDSVLYVCISWGSWFEYDRQQKMKKWSSRGQFFNASFHAYTWEK
jgi:hypothetical protein